MDGEIVFRIILGAALAALAAIRIVYQRKMRHALSGDYTTAESFASLITAAAVLTAGFVVACLAVIAPGVIAWSRLPLPGWLRWLGAGLAGVGTPLMLWSHAALGHNYGGGATIVHGHKLVTSGPYRLMRHPMYTAFFAMSGGYFLLSASWLVGLLWIGGFVGTVAWRLGKEEALLVDAFGDEYRDYVQRTGRFLPRLRR
jgi:protein-S-isoprenylcysteine O-methyltransferase Ste14